MDKELEEAIKKLKTIYIKGQDINNNIVLTTLDLHYIGIVLNRLEQYQKQLDLDYVDKNYILKKKVEDKKKLFEEVIDFNKEYKDKTLEDIEMESQWAMLIELLEDK